MAEREQQRINDQLARMKHAEEEIATHRAELQKRLEELKAAEDAAKKAAGEQPQPPR